jgi:hypothetical protein
MAGAADFTIIRHGPTALIDPINPEHADTFTLPNDVDVQQGAILGLLVDTNVADNLRLQVSINTHPVESTAPYKGDVFNTIDEIIQPIDAHHGTLQPGPNTITYKMTTGTGNVAVSDVVLWWRHKVPSPGLS